MFMCNAVKLNLFIAVIFAAILCFGLWYSSQRNLTDTNCDEYTEYAGGSDVTTNIAIESHCRNEEFQCTSGQCIELENTCDGHIDCDDQSDETIEKCSPYNCPKFAFKCGYGACIEKSKICNGVVDCRDGSDEDESRCAKYSSSTTPPKTQDYIFEPRDDHFQCISGEYISLHMVCDGSSDCVDKSDETVEECSLFKCPSYAFQCSYGGCIEMTKKCDGHTDCRDGSDEIHRLCDDESSPKTKSPHSTSEPTNYSTTVPNEVHEKCVECCPKEKLKGVTFTAVCMVGTARVPCGDQIKPGTIAKIACKERYTKPDQNSIDYLLCQDDGTWDYNPVACESVCGEELLQTEPLSANDNDFNISYVPWHAGIYHNFSGQKFDYMCGATIVSAKVLITAAHCFWNWGNRTIIDKSYFEVGAGKYKRDYYEDETYAVFNKISKLVMPEDYGGEANNFKSDIAVIVLTNFLQFNSYIGPACIDWQQGAAKTISSNVYGRISGWDEDDYGIVSKDLRTITVPSSSYEDCRKEAGNELAVAVPANKFCVLNKSGSVLCRGSGGGGFIEKKNVTGRYINYLWGVVSGGVPIHKKCSHFKFTTYTNIQYFKDIIKPLMIENIPY